MEEKEKIANIMNNQLGVKDAITKEMILEVPNGAKNMPKDILKVFVAYFGEFVFVVWYSETYNSVKVL